MKHSGTRRGAWMFVAGLALSVTGCVVSTHGAPGDPPRIPVAVPEPEEEDVSRAGEPEQIAARHVLVAYQGADRAAPYVNRTREEAQALARDIREQALTGEDFAALAREHSDDRGSAAQGGDLGQFGRGQMVREFSDAAFGLEPGGISEVVETGFGFHVIQRTE